MTEPWLIAIATNAIVLLTALWAVSVRLTYKAGQTKAEIIAAITTHAREDENEFAKVRRELYSSVHDFGETIMALKQKLSDVELHSANVYVRREGLIQLTDSIAALRSEIRADLLRMEQKIDSKT